MGKLLRENTEKRIRGQVSPGSVCNNLKHQQLAVWSVWARQ